MINRINQPRFELRSVSEGVVVLRYRGAYPVVLGGSYAFERGPILATAEGFRAGTGGIYLPRLSETVFHTGASGLGELQLGEVVTISYRRAPCLPFDKDKRMHKTTSWEVDPLLLYGKDRKNFHGWKTSTLVLNSQL